MNGTNVDKSVIIGKIQDHSYYQECLESYLIKYMHPKGMLLSWLIISLCIVLASAGVVQITGMDQITVPYPLPIYFNDTGDSFAHIKPLAKGTETVNQAISRYFITKYITIRESYDPTVLDQDSWDKKNSKVEVMSTRRVYGKYDEQISLSNPDSPLLVYKNITKREIEVTGVKFIGKQDPPSRALVSFSVKETTKGEETTTLWKAQVDFTSSDANVLDEKSYMQFMITDYTVWHQ